MFSTRSEDVAFYESIVEDVCILLGSREIHLSPACCMLHPVSDQRQSGNGSGLRGESIPNDFAYWARIEWYEFNNEQVVLAQTTINFESTSLGISERTDSLRENLL